jgi:predicted benzoate:H+ symporter BenE
LRKGAAATAPSPAARQAFCLGRWSLPVNGLAVVWGIAVIVNLAWPRVEVYGEGPMRPYSALIATGLMMGVGGLYYSLVQRHKTGVLDAHRADDEMVSQPSIEALGSEVG